MILEPMQSLWESDAFLFVSLLTPNLLRFSQRYYLIHVYRFDCSLKSRYQFYILSDALKTSYRLTTKRGGCGQVLRSLYHVNVELRFFVCLFY